MEDKFQFLLKKYQPRYFTGLGKKFGLNVFKRFSVHMNSDLQDECGGTVDVVSYMWVRRND